MDTNDYPDINPKSLCKTCLGCQQMEQKNFFGKLKCDRYIKDEKEEPFYYGSKYGNNN